MKYSKRWVSRIAIVFFSIGAIFFTQPSVNFMTVNSGLVLAADFDVPSASFATVQEAIDAALSDPTPSDQTHRVRVSQGTYHENINIQPSGYKDNFRLDIQGGWTSDFTNRVENPELTTLDGGSSGSVIIVYNSLFTGITLSIDGFTIQNGDATDEGITDDTGGGIDICSNSWYGNASITVENNIIRNNTAFGFGGGIYVSLSAKNEYTAAVFIQNNKIHYNEAEVMGGGVYAHLSVSDSEPSPIVFASVKGNEMISNSVTQVKAFNNNGSHGGGLVIASYNTSFATINSNTFSNNTSAYTTGGVYVSTSDDSSISFFNNTVRENQATESTGGLSGSARDDSILTVENNLLAENLSITKGGASISTQDSGSVYFRHNYVLSNEASESTAGLSVLANKAGLIEAVNNLIAFNTALNGTSGGVSISAWVNGRANFYNNTVADNYASSNWGSGFFYIKDTTASIVGRNNIFWGNTTDDLSDDSLYFSGEISNIQFLFTDYYTISPVSGWDGAGDPSNISVDPLFVEGPLGYHYLSQTAAGQASDSPCKDAGDGLAADYGLENRFTRSDQVIDSSTVDMGFHYPLKTEEEKPGDADGDGDVDGSDISGFVEAFPSEPGDANYIEAYDLDESHGITDADLAILVIYFGG